MNVPTDFVVPYVEGQIIYSKMLSIDCHNYYLQCKVAQIRVQI